MCGTSKASTSSWKVEQLQLASVLPLSRCSSTPTQNKTHDQKHHRAHRTSKENEPYVETSNSCLFGRTNPFETDFSIKEQVAEGGFGKIYKCKSNIDGQWYVVKMEQFRFKPQAYFNPSEVYEIMMKEALVLSRLDHENVCRYYNTWVFGSLISMDKLQIHQQQQEKYGILNQQQLSARVAITPVVPLIYGSPIKRACRTNYPTFQPSPVSPIKTTEERDGSSHSCARWDEEDDFLIEKNFQDFDDLDFGDLGFEMENTTTATIPDPSLGPIRKKSLRKKGSRPVR
jgi:hypothetical protein